MNGDEQVNPFWSQGVQDAVRVDRLRPAALPPSRATPESLPPVPADEWDGDETPRPVQGLFRAMGSGGGRVRSQGQMPTNVAFETPNSWKSIGTSVGHHHTVCLQEAFRPSVSIRTCPRMFHLIQCCDFVVPFIPRLQSASCGLSGLPFQGLSMLTVPFLPNCAAMRNRRGAEKRGRDALQRQALAEDGNGTRCFNLVAEPRWFLTLATLLIAVVAGCWMGCGGGLKWHNSVDDGRQLGVQHVSFELEHQSTFTTILARSTTMTERVVTAATTIDGSKTDERSKHFAKQPSTSFADLTTSTPGVPLKHSSFPSDFGEQSLDDLGADGLDSLCLFEQHSVLVGASDNSNISADRSDHVESHSGNVNHSADHFQDHSGQFNSNSDHVHSSGQISSKADGAAQQPCTVDKQRTRSLVVSIR